MEEKIYGIISAITGISTEELEKLPDSENLWESFQKVEIVLGIEEEFDIFFEQEEIAGMSTISDILEITKRKI